MEHKYAQVLRWIADGKKFQWKNGHGIWQDQDHDGCLKRLPDWDFDLEEFRLAPRTVKVGDVEIEAPLQEISQGDCVYYKSFDGVVYPMNFDVNSKLDKQQLFDGRLFATREAAEAAHAAWVKLMTE